MNAMPRAKRDGAPKRSVLQVMLIRHAQSGNNALWQATGGSRGRSPDPSITDLGRAQAAALAGALAAGRYPRPTHLHTSLMLRAVQTAAPLADVLDLPLLGHLDTFEYFGPVVMDPDDDTRRWPHPGAGAADLTALSARLVLPEGAGDDGWWAGPVEGRDAVRQRARRVLDWLVAEYGGTDALPALVTHGTFSQYLIQAVLGIPEMTGWIAVHNTGVSLFRVALDDSATTIATAINRLDHLAPDQISD